MSEDSLREEVQALAAVRAELERIAAACNYAVQPGMPLPALAAAIRGVVEKPVIVTFVWDEDDDYVYVEHNGVRVWGESSFDRLGQYLEKSAPSGYVLMCRRVDTVVAREQAPGACG
jgi:hypothetical protein